MKVQWTLEAQEVIITGNFDAWGTNCRMTKDECGIFAANISVKEWPLVFKFLVDGKWMVSSEYPTLPDDQGNINNVLSSDQSQLKDSVQEKSNVRLEIDQPALAAIPEETSPEIRKFQLPEVVTEQDKNDKQKEWQVPRMSLTDVDGNESWLPIVPSIVVTDVYGNIKEENIYEIPKAPAVHSFSDSSVGSAPSDSELEVPEGDKEPIKASRKYKDPARTPFTEFTSEQTLHIPEGDKEPINAAIKFKDASKKPFKGLKKRASRFMQSIKKAFSKLSVK